MNRLGNARKGQRREAGKYDGVDDELRWERKLLPPMHERIGEQISHDSIGFVVERIHGEEERCPSEDDEENASFEAIAHGTPERLGADGNAKENCRRDNACEKDAIALVDADE